MKANQAEYEVHAMCRATGFSPSGYYAWLKREPPERAKADAVLTERIREIHVEARGPTAYLVFTPCLRRRVFTSAGNASRD